jgi:formylglycine-generating enzyme required for sulfatase activity
LFTKPFYLGKYQVTQEQWEAVMGSNPRHFKGSKNTGGNRSLGGLPAISRKTQQEGPHARREVRIASGGTVGICLPCGEYDEVLRWG